MGKSDGGLGLRNISLFKQGWNLATNPDSLLSRLFKAVYFPTCSFLKAATGRRPSLYWRGLLWGRTLGFKRVGWLSDMASGNYKFCSVPPSHYSLTRVVDLAFLTMESNNHATLLFSHWCWKDSSNSYPSSSNSGPANLASVRRAYW